MKTATISFHPYFFTSPLKPCCLKTARYSFPFSLEKIDFSLISARISAWRFDRPNQSKIWLHSSGCWFLSRECKVASEFNKSNTRKFPKFVNSLLSQGLSCQALHTLPGHCKLNILLLWKHKMRCDPRLEMHHRKDS